MLNKFKYYSKKNAILIKKKINYSFKIDKKN